MTSKFTIIVLIILLIIGLGFDISKSPLSRYVSVTEDRYDEPQSCTTDAKICPDGTAVGRTGPNCEFAACPTVSSPHPNVTSSTNPSTTGEEITVSGKMICLPHKNTSGPQTLECAMGMKAEDGKNYALSDPNWKFLIGIGTEQKITVTGILKPPANDKYDTVGTIEVSNLSKE
jgi:hypothetical protein